MADFYSRQIEQRRNENLEQLHDEQRRERENKIIEELHELNNQADFK